MASALSVKPKWWWDHDRDKWERAGWVVTCGYGDLEHVCSTQVEARRIMVVHAAVCRQQSLFPVE